MNTLRHILIGLLVFLNTAHLHAQFQTNGSATAIVTDTCYRLTQAINTQMGSVWNVNQVDLYSDFEILANLYFGNYDPGADGMVFAFQQVSVSAGNSGGGMGIQNVTPSLFVPFDTYQNGVDCDPTFDHVSINKNGDTQHFGINSIAAPVQASATSANIEDGLDHLVLIRWLVNSQNNTQTIEVYFDCVLRLTATDNFIGTIFNNNPNVFWGFTAATGGLNNEQSFCFEYVSALATNLGDQSICIVGEGTQIAAPPIGTSYSWTPSTSLSNPNIEDPIATPLVTTTYTVAISNICGNTVLDSLTVFVLDTSMTYIDTSICEGESYFAAGALQTTTAVYIDTFLNQHACDSIVTTTIAVIDTSQTSFTANICQNSNFNFNGTLLNAAGIYVDTLINSNGCDSIITLNLALWPLDSTNVDTSICMGESFSWNGQFIQSAGVYFAGFINNQNCDSTVILTVSYLQSDTVIQDTTICDGDSFTWFGQQIQNEGTYSVSFLNAAGCDSSIFLNVIVNELYLSAVFDTICVSDSIFLQNDWQNTAGIYLDTIFYTNTYCDSLIITTNLSLTPIIITSRDTFLCNGSSFEFNQMLIANAGIYLDTIAAPNGCNEIIELNVLIRNLPIAEITGNTSFCIEDGSELLGTTSSPLINWLPVSSSDNPLNILDGALYILESIDSLGCIGRDSLLVSAIEGCYELILPTAFSPNGDGVNDSFQPLNIPMELYTISIYNRYGELVYESDEPRAGWDGSFKGRNIEIGSYAFTTEYQFKPSHEPKKLNGTLTVIR